jgi:hypothetical protein
MKWLPFFSAFSTSRLSASERRQPADTRVRSAAARKCLSLEPFVIE